jgi:hypothetical protein
LVDEADCLRSTVISATEISGALMLDGWNFFDFTSVVQQLRES